MLDIKVKFKTIWGRDRFKPLSPDAVFLAKVIGKQTLNRRQLIVCKEAGCKIKIPNMDVNKYLSEDFET